MNQVRKFGLSTMLRSLRASKGGAAAAEFALVAPLLFSMTLGVIEYGFVFYGYSSMQYAANNVARAIALTVTAQKSNAADPSTSNILVRVVANASNTTPLHIFTNAFPLTLTADVAVKQELPYDN